MSFGGDLLPATDWKEDMDALEADFGRWRDDISGVAQGLDVDMSAGRQALGGQAPSAVDPGGNAPEGPSAALLDLKKEIQDISRDLRDTHVGFAIQPGTAMACAASVKTSAMWQKKQNEKKGRLDYIYAAGCSYDTKKT